MAEKSIKYHVPESSPWPLSASMGLLLMAVGGSTFMSVKDTSNWSFYVLMVGVAWMICTLFMWWRDTIKESLAGLNNAQLATSYRQGMTWFIFSEVMFFSAFFGALFYTRWLILPWLAGDGIGTMTHEVLWPDFQNLWPLTTAPDGRTTTAMGAWGLPAINTALLITSSITLTIAHHALVLGNRQRAIWFHGLTILCGLVFLSLQVEEYIHAYNDLGLTLNSGIYGSLFFMLTGFHGVHVTVGTIMLVVMFLRLLKGHFTAEDHFAYEATAWYWHFVDVVWLFLFFVVYWL